MESICNFMQHVTLSSIIRRVFCLLVILSLGNSIQTNDLDVSESQFNSNHKNVTRLKEDSSDLRQLYNNDKESNFKLSTYKKSLLFSSWSSWSDCDRRCKQKRSRKCINRRKCGSVKQIEERTCEEHSCSRSPKDFNDELPKSSQKSPKHHKSKQRKKPEDDPYAADDEDDEYLRTKRHNDNIDSDSINEIDNRIVMKVVKQGDYRHKQFHNQRSGSTHSDIEQEFFLPRNVSSYNLRTPPNSTSSLLLKQINFDNDESEDDNEDGELDEEINDTRSRIERGKTKAVFEVPRKPISNYSKWSRWSRCSAKCVTRRFKKCRPHAKHICGNDVIREIAYCYTEGSFCEEWIHSQITKLNTVESKTTTTTTTKAPRTSRRRTESPLSNAISPNFYGNSIGNKKKDKMLDNYKAQNIQCGFPSIRNKNTDFNLKIIGGKVARRGAWPWQVAILNRYKEAFCGGTLVTPNWVLTASHCVRKRLYVILGEHNLNIKEGSEIEFRIQTAIKHPKYNKKTVDSDIAMLKLPQSVERSHFIGFACLPEKSQQLPVGHTCTVTGWGKRKHSDDSGTNLLHEADVPIISHDQCRNVYHDYVITRNMFCAGGHRRDTCSGDSGGGLICRDAKKSNRPWTLYGITSFGDGCGKKNKFGIYTKLTNYVDFIWSIVNCNGLCENTNNNTI